MHPPRKSKRPIAKYSQPSPSHFSLPLNSIPIRTRIRVLQMHSSVSLRRLASSATKPSALSMTPIPYLFASYCFTSSPPAVRTCSATSRPAFPRHSTLTAQTSILICFSACFSKMTRLLCTHSTPSLRNLPTIIPPLGIDPPLLGLSFAPNSSIGSNGGRFIDRRSLGMASSPYCFWSFPC